MVRGHRERLLRPADLPRTRTTSSSLTPTACPSSPSRASRPLVTRARARWATLHAATRRDSSPLARSVERRSASSHSGVSQLSGHSRGQVSVGQASVGPMTVGSMSGQLGGQVNVGQMNGQLNGQMNSQMNIGKSSGQMSIGQQSVGQMSISQSNLSQSNLSQSNLSQSTTSRSTARSTASPATLSQSHSGDALSNMLAFVRAQLQAAPGGTLKAVELANSVRDTFGNGLLSLIRERHLGLLNLLESFPQLFKVALASGSHAGHAHPQERHRLARRHRGRLGRRRGGELRGAASDGLALSARGERGRADDGGPSAERVRAVRSHRGREDRPPGR